MSSQLALPARWATLETRRDPSERLRRLRSDMAETKARIQEALHELAERHGIPPRDVAYALEGYADDMLSDLVFPVERELEREIDGDT